MMNLKYCECGCGQIVKRRFISGHNSKTNQSKICHSEFMKGRPSPMKGKHHSEESKIKMSKNSARTMTGKYLSEETKQKIRDKRALQVFSEEAKAKMRQSHLGKSSQKRGCKLSDETKRKISEKVKRLYENPEYRKMTSESTKRGMTIEGKRKIAVNNSNRIVSECTKVKMSLAAKGKIISQQTRQKLREANKGKKASEQTKKKLSIKTKKSWQNSNFVEKQLISRALHPNKPETIILNLLNKLYPNEWKFTGDFSFMINGKNPDFTNINGQKKLIELFGDYWHKGEDPNDRINIFKPFGWDTLVIWECELKNTKQLKRKIFDFCEEKYTVELTGEIL